MSTENKIPENILAAIELKKGSVASIIKLAWEGTKEQGLSPTGHFCQFQLTLIDSLRKDESLVFTLTLGLLADHLLPILTEEEKEALRDESINLGK